MTNRIFWLSRERMAWLYRRHFGGVAAPVLEARIQLKENAAFVAALSGFLRSHSADSANDSADDFADITNAQCLATITAHACLRPDHLWRDLELGGRDEVTAIFSRYFPALVTRNTDGTRWKKFLARELALSMGIAPRPAPGCPGCEDFDLCFGSRT
jgi:nitrogen fixation protein NifQ